MLVVELTVVPAAIWVSPVIAGKLEAGSVVAPVGTAVAFVALTRMVLAG
jgi:hypothetical protein